MASTFKNAGKTLGITSGSGANVYTPGSNTAVIHAVYISNHSSANVCNVNVEVYDNSATTTYFVGKSLEIATNNTLVLDKPINLEANDALRVYADPLSDSSTPNAQAFLSVLEVS